MLADGNGELSEALGLALDARGFGMGIRCQRFAMIVEDGVITTLNVEPAKGVVVSAADEILKLL
jgi:peroxiredoxin